MKRSLILALALALPLQAHATSRETALNGMANMIAYITLCGGITPRLSENQIAALSHVAAGSGVGAADRTAIESMAMLIAAEAGTNIAGFCSFAWGNFNQVAR